MFSVNSTSITTKYLGKHFDILGNLTTTLAGMITCPNTFMIVVSASINNGTNYFLNIFNSSFVNLQSLNYLTNQVNAMVCSENYLVSIDINGNLFVDTYTQTQDPSIFITKFARWILWVIIGCGSFLVVVIVVVIIICCRRKRRAKGLNNTIKEGFSVEEGKFGDIYEENDWNNSTNRYKNDSKRVSELQDMTAPNYHQKPNRNN